MVVEGGERVRVGELHVVTLNGGTVGRESTNAVHLPDLNISKVSWWPGWEREREKEDRLELFAQ